MTTWSSSCLCINGWFTCFFFFFSLNFSLHLFVCCLSSERQTAHRHGHFSTKPVDLFVCVCHVGWDMFCIWHMQHPDSLSLLLFSFPAAFKTLPEGRRSGCSLWFESPRGQLHQTENRTCAVEKVVIKPCCQTQWLKCFWLSYTTRVRGCHYGNGSPATKKKLDMHAMRTMSFCQL